MDLLGLKPSERVIEIVHPGTKECLGVRVTIMHINDERLKKIKRQFQDERYRLEQRGKTFKAENVENNINELTFAAMTGWEWYNPTGLKGDKGFDETKQPTFNGKIPTFSKKEVLEVFEQLPFFRDQIGEEVGDDQSFFPT